MSRSTALPASSGVGRALSEFPLLYRALRTPVRGVLERWFRLRVEGAEHLPECGPYLVAANHHNYLDGVVLGVSVPAPITFLVMPRVWAATPLHPVFHRHIGSIPLNLDRADVGALRRALAALECGRVVGIFPEGPFSVSGTWEALRGRRFYVPRATPLAVRFGPPRRFSANGGSARETRRDVTARIMADIAALLP